MRRVRNDGWGGKKAVGSEGRPVVTQGPEALEVGTGACATICRTLIPGLPLGPVLPLQTLVPWRLWRALLALTGRS